MGLALVQSDFSVIKRKIAVDLKQQCVSKPTLEQEIVIFFMQHVSSPFFLQQGIDKVNIKLKKSHQSLT